MIVSDEFIFGLVLGLTLGVVIYKFITDYINMRKMLRTDKK